MGWSQLKESSEKNWSKKLIKSRKRSDSPTTRDLGKIQEKKDIEKVEWVKNV
jgi:hypothetical protein